MDLGCGYRCGVQGMHSLTSLGMFSVHMGVFESFVPTSTCAWACGQAGLVAQLLCLGPGSMQM